MRALGHCGNGPAGVGTERLLEGTWIPESLSPSWIDPSAPHTLSAVCWSPWSCGGGRGLIRGQWRCYTTVRAVKGVAKACLVMILGLPRASHVHILLVGTVSCGRISCRGLESFVPTGPQLPGTQWPHLPYLGFPMGQGWQRGVAPHRHG